MTSHLFRILRRALVLAATATAGFAVCVTAVAIVGQPARAGTFDAFGPEYYSRANGKPVVVADSFSIINPETTYTIRVVGHGPAGQPGNLVSSAEIWLNGARIFGPPRLSRAGPPGRRTIP